MLRGAGPDSRTPLETRGRRTRRARLIRLGGIAAFNLVVAALLCELVLRILLFADFLPPRLGAFLRDPGRFAHADSDDYWKLRTRWVGLFQGRLEMGPFHDARLGFTTPRTVGNPLGAAGLPSVSRDPGSEAPAVLFYGDSFLTRPFWTPSERIPQLLEAQLGGTPVWNLGVAGYGLDQIVLRFESTHTRFADPTVLLGILTDDVERNVLSVRQGQKPRFVLDESGELRLTNLPILNDQGRFLREHPPEIPSYASRMLRMGLEQTALARLLPRLRRDHRIDEKKALADALIRRAFHHGALRGIPLRFVIFRSPHEIEGPSWRAEALRRPLDALEAPYLDTRAPLLTAMESGAVTLEELYDDTRHLTPRGNELVVEALLARWPELAQLEAPASAPQAAAGRDR